MERSTRDPKARTACPDGCCAHGTGIARPGVMPQSVDRPGELQNRRWHLCRSLSAALDGWVPIVVVQARLEELRDVAARSDCPLADILLAVFGRVLDGHDGHIDPAIAILSADQAVPGRREGRRRKRAPEVRTGATMPLDMRLAIARAAAEDARRPPTRRGVAFRHTRRGLVVDRIAPEPLAGHIATRQDLDDFDLVLDIGEFADMLLVECFFRTGAMGIQAVEKLVRNYFYALQAVVTSFDGEP